MIYPLILIYRFNVIFKLSNVIEKIVILCKKFNQIEFINNIHNIVKIKYITKNIKNKYN